MDFDKIILTAKEYFILNLIRFRKSTSSKFIGNALKTFQEYHFVIPNVSDDTDVLGNKIPDGTYRISKTGIRYCIYSRRQFLRRYITPIVVAFITTVVTRLSESLWLPGLLNWIQGLP